MNTPSKTRRGPSPLGAAVALAATLGFAGRADAQEGGGAPAAGPPQMAGAVTDRASPFQERVQTTVGLRFGSENLDGGIGLRAGYTLPNKLHLGGAFDYFFGESEKNQFVSATARVWMAMAEIGYDLPVLPNVVLRPFGGLGIAKASAKVCALQMCTSASESEAAIVLGGLVSVVAGSFFAGGDVRLLFVDDSAVIFGAHAGLAF